MAKEHRCIAQQKSTNQAKGHATEDHDTIWNGDRSGGKRSSTEGGGDGTLGCYAIHWLNKAG